MSQMPAAGLSYPGAVPLTIGQILDRVFRVFRARFWLFLRVSLVPSVILLIIYGALLGALYLAGFFPQPGHVADPQKVTSEFFPIVAGASLAIMGVMAFLETATCFAALRTDAGLPVTAREALGVVSGKLGRFVWLMILRMLIVFGPGMFCFALLAAVMVPATHRTGNPHMAVAFVSLSVMVLLYLGWIVYAIFTMLRLALSVPACLAENLTAVESLKRSLQLTKNAKGRIFLVLLVVYAATYVAVFLLEIGMMVVGAAGMLLASLLPLHFAPPWSYVALGAGVVVGMFIFSMFMAATWALYATAFAVLYRDQRHRFEGSVFEWPAGEPA